MPDRPDLETVDVAARPVPAGAPRDAELAAEQAHVDASYARLDALRRSALSVSEAYSDVQRGGTHQARLERDIAYDLTQRRLADLDIGDAPLCFGRLDLEAEATYYIGRLAVDDDDRTPLVVDWRAPVAEPFYRATAVEPMGVVRRRHFLTRRGREVIGLDDEVFDRDATDSAGLTVTGEGALMAALDRERTGRMGDIVATIQAEQDLAIRADLPGVLVVTGGPGTGKTAVALHRAAYLLYTHRRRLGSRGVLLVGPSAVFLRYIEQVLPSLGEHEVQLSTIAGLKPGLGGLETEEPRRAALKGDARMAEVVAAAVADRQRPLPRDRVLVVDGVRVVLTRRDTARIVKAARARRGSHNERRPYVVQRVVGLLAGRWKRQAVRDHERRRLDRPPALALDDAAGPDPTVVATLARGEAPPEGFDRELQRRLRRRAEVRDALDRMWPVVSGRELVTDLLGLPPLLRSAARDVLTPPELDLLGRPWVADTDEVVWTDADVALVDEADHVLGPVEAARPRRRRRRGPSDEELETATRVIEELGLHGSTDAATLAGRFVDDGGASGPPELRTFAHVLVDEAQDLTPMQWRMLARRCPSGSMTLVGDPGQASRPGAVSSWEAALAHVPRRQAPRFAELSVNYRTPAEIMDVASRLLAVAAPTVPPSRSVRSTGVAPRFEATDRASLVDQAVACVRAAVARGGKVAAVAPSQLHGVLAERLVDEGAVAGVAEAIDAPVAVLDATDVKGLEFDHVVVVEPATLVTADRAGLRLLYMAITRATQTLAVVHAEPLPEALERV